MATISWGRQGDPNMAALSLDQLEDTNAICLPAPDDQLTKKPHLSRTRYDICLAHTYVRIYRVYTIILHKSVCRHSQAAGRNYCSIVSGDVSN